MEKNTEKKAEPEEVREEKLFRERQKKKNERMIQSDGGREEPLLRKRRIKSRGRGKKLPDGQKERWRGRILTSVVLPLIAGHYG